LAQENFTEKRQRDSKLGNDLCNFGVCIFALAFCFGDQVSMAINQSIVCTKRFCPGVL